MAGVAGVNWIAVPIDEIDVVPTHGEPDGDSLLPTDSPPNGEPEEFFLFPDTRWENPQRLLVVTGNPDDEWIEVVVPNYRPVGQTRWVRSEFFDFESSDYVIHLDLETSTVEVWQQGQLVLSDTNPDGAIGDPAIVPNGQTHWVETIRYEQEGLHPESILLGTSSDCADCVAVPGVSIRGQGEGANPTLPDGVFHFWMNEQGFQDLLDLVPVGTPIEISGGR